MKRDAFLFRGTMTKATLMSMQEGAFMMSCVTDETAAPLFVGAIPTLQAREMFWRHLKLSGVAGRTCWVFASADDYQLFLRSNPIENAPPGSPFSREGNRMN